MAWNRLGPRLFALCVGIAMVCAAVVLSNGALGSAMLGEMDAVWKQHVRDANLYTFPGEWRWADWVAMGIACLIH